MNVTLPLLLSLLMEDPAADQHLLSTATTRTIGRTLQSLPDYTSPPTSTAVDATPLYYQPDTVINTAREAALNDQCSDLHFKTCQILFPPNPNFDSHESPKLGVLFYGGALVDPRSYSPLAKELTDRYGLAVSIPIFHQDVAFEGCTSNRLQLAQDAFPTVEKWIMAGHSMGGIGVMAEVYTAFQLQDEDGESEVASATTATTAEQTVLDNSAIGGFVLIASYARQDVGCGLVNFTNYDLPAASVSAHLDGVINYDNWSFGQSLLSQEHTFSLDILGGNHGNFGSYDDSGRTTILGQNDGVATIPEIVQQDLTVSAIMHVVSRAGIALPMTNSNMQYGDGANKKKSTNKKTKKGKRAGRL